MLLQESAFSSQESALSSIQAEISEIKKVVEQLKVSAQEKPQQPPPKPKVADPPPKNIELDGIRLRGIPETEDKTPRQRYEHDKRAVNLMLQHLNINTETTDIRRMGVFQAGRARTSSKLQPNGTNGLSSPLSQS